MGLVPEDTHTFPRTEASTQTNLPQRIETNEQGNNRSINDLCDVGCSRLHDYDSMMMAS